MNPHEAAGRATKVLKLIETIDRLAAEHGATRPVGPKAAEILRSWSAADWRTVAVEAGCNAPSATTIAALCLVIEERGEPRPSVAKGEPMPPLDAAAELATALRHHDWSYHYADDARAFERGRLQAERISALVARLDVEAARRIWSENAPAGQPFQEARRVA